MRLIERVWQWHFAASPEALWPLLADTARFNEAIGLPRYQVEETPEPDGTVRRIGSVRRFGRTLSWEEGVPEWVAPRRFMHERRFLSGPLRRIATEITLDSAAAAGGQPGSLVGYRLGIEPRWPGIGLLLRLALLDRLGSPRERDPSPAIRRATPEFSPQRHRDPARASGA